MPSPHSIESRSHVGAALAAIDPEISALVEREADRQERTLDLVAAESTAPEAVLQALGSVFNNKTAEGFPGRRYHRGCEVTDELELLAIHRARSLFGADHANVQPHSGVNANLAVYQAVLSPGDPVLSMDLSHGGHLSHGSDASITGHVYAFTHYGVRPDDERIDYNDVRKRARAARPRLIIAGGSSYPRLIDYAALREISDEVSALLLVDMAHIAGLVAAQVIPSPVPFADFVTFTTYKTMLGPHGGIILCRAEHARRLDRAVFPGTQGAPAMSQVAAKAVCLRSAGTDLFVRVQRRILETAGRLSLEMERLGYRPVTGGTDTHMVLVDLRSKGLTGNRAEERLERVGIITNRNVVPFDPESTRVTSGLRLAATVLVLRGMGPAEMDRVAAVIERALVTSDEPSASDTLRADVADLCSQFPLFGGPWA